MPSIVSARVESTRFGMESTIELRPPAQMLPYGIFVRTLLKEDIEVTVSPTDTIAQLKGAGGCFGTQSRRKLVVLTTKSKLGLDSDRLYQAGLVACRLKEFSCFREGALCLVDMSQTELDLAADQLEIGKFGGHFERFRMRDGFAQEARRGLKVSQKVE